MLKQNDNSPKHKIIGIGNAIMDYFCYVDDEFLIKNSLTKGSMTLITKEQFSNLNKLSIEKFSSGGSVANTICSLAQLLNNSPEFITAFIGSIGNDLAGQQFINDNKKNKIEFIGQINPDLETASSFIFITPDGQRTMCTYLGCSPFINTKSLQPHHFINCKILYIEGYLWDDANTIEAIRNAIKIAKQQNCKIAFSLSDSFCVDRHQQEFLQFISQDIDILFANEMEINKLCGIKEYNSDKIQNFIAKLNQNIMLATTLGDKGCQIYIQQNQILIPTTAIKPLDTTGAGDNFAGGFLYGFVKGFEIKKCAEIGNIMAGKIIEKIGARFSFEEINNLKKFF
jgi:sugar/nucleoside kinase (ribokinase family)